MPKSKRYANEIYNGFKARRLERTMVDAPDIFYAFKDAVVSVHAQTTFLTGATGGAEETITESGTGFFIAPGTIVTAAHLVMVDNFAGLRQPPVPAAYSTFARCGKIMVMVTNVNRCGKGYLYYANLVGVSPSLDIAVLCIDNKTRPECQPVIKDHPIFNWGCSRESAIGEKVFLIGDTPNRSSVGISQGIITDNLYGDNLLDSADPGTYWGFEAVLSDADTMPGNSGGPLINSHCEVVGVISGMDTYASNVPGPFPIPNLSYTTVAVSSKIARRVVDGLLGGCGPHRQLLTDPLGDYFRYQYGWLGITGFESYGPNILRAVPDAQYKVQGGFVITSLDASSPFNGIFNNMYTFPIATPALPPSPTNEIYLITDIGCHAVGVGDGQVPFSSVTSSKLSGDKVKVTYRVGSGGFGESFCCEIELADFPFTEDLTPPLTAAVSAISNRGNGLQGIGGLQALQDRGMLKDLGADLIRLLMFYGNNLTSILGNGKMEAASSNSMVDTLEAILAQKTDAQ